MKNLSRYLMLILIALMLATCKKEHIQPSSILGQPVFSYSGTINGANFTFQAGTNNYYMYASYKQDSNNVYNFTGNLKSTKSNTNSIQFIINDYKVSAPSAAAVIDSSLVPGYYSYNKPGGNTTSYQTLFFPVLGSGTATSYSYVFGDGTTSASSSPPTHTYNHPGNYNTSIAVSFQTGCTTPLANQVKMGTPDAILAISSFKTYPKLDTNGIKYDSIHVNVGGGIPPYTYFWSFGDGNTKITYSGNVSHEYKVPGMYTASLKLSDAANDTSSFNGNILTPTYSDSCLANYLALVTPLSNALSLSNVTINYTDGAGNVYSSNNSLQPFSSTFQLMSVASYQNNENNQTTKMLKVQFNCILYPVSGTPIPASGTAVIAVAYR